jgi:AcrR family transcriptional regulator
MAPAAPTPAIPTTRVRIKAIAKDIYVLRGFDAFNFGEIADAVGITRANIHHHFGTKRALVGELAGEFADDAASRTIRIWSTGGLREALSLQLDDLRRFYHRYNPHPGDRNVWSPLARLRLDEPRLGPLARTALERTNAVYDQALGEAVRRAIEAGELRPDTPERDVVRLLRAAILSSPAMTQDTGSFDELENLFAALERSLFAAWGPPADLT